MNLSPRSVERLNKLADVLVEIPKYIKGFGGDQITTLACTIESFNMDHWGCGTSACAAGIAMVHPWFRKRGFGYYIEREGNGLYNEFRSPRLKYGLGKYVEDEDAIKQFFGINDDQVRFLFMPGSYPETHKQAPYVADRIRKFVRRDGEIVSPNFVPSPKRNPF